MSGGDLFPDECHRRLAELSRTRRTAYGFKILDGFLPRTVPHAEALDRKMDELGRELTQDPYRRLDDEVTAAWRAAHCEAQGHAFIEFTRLRRTAPAISTAATDRP